MEDVASFIRRRKWENPPGNGMRDEFEERPQRPFRPMGTPPRPTRDIPRQSPPADIPQIPKFTPTPPPQPQPAPAPKSFHAHIPLTAAEHFAAERFDSYDSLWASILATTSSLMDIELSFTAFPWPVLCASPPKSAADIKQVDVEDFVFHRLRIPRSDADYSTRRRQAVKDALLRWHPDKFMSGRVLSRVVEEDREKVKEAALAVGRILVGLVGK